MDASTSTDLVVQQPSSVELWPEPLNTPGVIPHHLTRATAVSSPLLEVIQRTLYRLRPTGTGDLEKVLALLALYQAIRPVYNTLKDFFLWACTVQVTIPENDPVAKEILAWVGEEIVQKSHTRSAILITGGWEASVEDFRHALRNPGAAPKRDDDQEVVYLPPLGTRLFW